MNEVTNKIYIPYYAVYSGGFGDNSTVAVIDGATNKITATPYIGFYDPNVFVNPTTNQIYTDNGVLDGATNSFTAYPHSGAFFPAPLAVNTATNQVFIHDYTLNTVDIYTFGKSPSIAPTGSPFILAMAANSKTNKTYVAGFQNNLTNDTIWVIDSATKFSIQPDALISSTPFVYSRVTKTFNTTLTLTNDSAWSLEYAGPVQLVFTGLGANATLVHPTGTFQGYPYLTLPGGLPLPYQGTVSVQVQFSDPSLVNFSAIPVVYSGSLN